MDIGVPRETFIGENRIALSPLAVKALTEAGHNVYIQEGAGNVSFYDDEHFVKSGATIVYHPEEIYGRAKLIAKVERPNEDELDMLEEDQILMSFLQPSASDPKKFLQLIGKKICSIGYEIIQDDNADLPIVRSLSEIAGSMTVSIASRYLESTGRGRGILLGGAPGVPPAEVVIIGAGIVGASAADAAINMGASVTLLDKDISAMRKVMRRISARGTLVTAVASKEHIDKALSYADVLITAVMVRGGARAPMVVCRDQVRSMKKGSVIIDASIDIGGAVETSRPTTLQNPTFVDEGVVHYCVPNMSSAVPRTASRVLSDSLLPFITEIADHGLVAGLRNQKSLARGVFTYNGKCCNEEISELFGLDYVALDKLLEASGDSK